MTTLIIIVSFIVVLLGCRPIIERAGNYLLED